MQRCSCLTKDPWGGGTCYNFLIHWTRGHSLEGLRAHAQCLFPRDGQGDWQPVLRAIEVTFRVARWSACRGFERLFVSSSLCCSQSPRSHQATRNTSPPLGGWSLSITVEARCWAAPCISAPFPALLSLGTTSMPDAQGRHETSASFTD